MSAALKVPNGNVMQSPRGRTKTLDDGSMVISVEELARFGDGDPRAGRRELRTLLELDREGQVFSGPTAKPDTVRIAGPADEEACLALWMLDLKANAEHVAPIDADKVMANIQAGTRRRGSIVGVIDGPYGKPVGMVVLGLMQWHWGHGWYYQEFCNFVHPDHRHTRHVGDLLDFSKWAMDEQSRGCGYRVHLLCGVLGGWRVRAKVALYRRKFQQVGSCHIYPAVPMRGN